MKWLGVLGLVEIPILGMGLPPKDRENAKLDTTTVESSFQQNRGKSNTTALWQCVCERIKNWSGLE